MERLARMCTGFGLAKELARISDVKQRILYTVELVENVTGIADFGGYLMKMLEIDAFFLNEDRHTNNIALLYDVSEKTYRLCPFYDMGLSLFSDTREAYPLDMGFEACRERITAKPFAQEFDEQLDAINELYDAALKKYDKSIGLYAKSKSAKGVYSILEGEIYKNKLKKWAINEMNETYHCKLAV